MNLYLDDDPAWQEIEKAADTALAEVLARDEYEACQQEMTAIEQEWLAAA